MAMDASFSSYLTPQQPKPASQEDAHEISIFDAHRYFSESNDVPKESKTSTVHVSPAMMMNNANLDLSTVPRLSSVSSVDGYSRNYRVCSFHATPTASSEASWNSQIGLLSNPPGSIAVSLTNIIPSDHPHHRHRKRGVSNATKWFFGRKCPCSGKKSVQVEEVVPSENNNSNDNNNNNSKPVLYTKRQSPKSDDQRNQENISSSRSLKSSVTNNLVERQVKVIIPNSQRFSSETQNHFTSSIISTHHHHQRILGSGGNGGFSFPILNPSAPVKPGVPPQSSTSPLGDPSRDSLEVFQPLDESISRKSMEVQQRIIGSNPASGFVLPGSPISRVTAATDDDVASDASSDLFEIESFSTQTTAYPMYRRRDSLDEGTSFNARRFATASNGIGTLYCRQSLDEPMTPSIAPTECYAPSEASIDWSVTTAEGFDRASVANFSISASDIEDIAIIQNESDKGGGGGSGGRRKGNGGGLLLSCRHEKAVSVGPQPHPVKCVPEEGHHPGGPPFPLISTFRHVSSRPPKPNKPPLARSHSARLSLALST